MAFSRVTSFFSSATPTAATTNENLINQETVKREKWIESWMKTEPAAELMRTDRQNTSSLYFDEFFVFLQIERLCDRLQLATRIDDRRDALRGLKNLSKVRVKFSTNKKLRLNC